MDLGQRYIEVDMGYEFDDWFIEELKSYNALELFQ